MLQGRKAFSFDRCFVSAPAGMDLGQLPEALSERGIDWQWAASNSIEAFNVYRAIRDADAVVAILDGATANYRVLHEMGVAAALEKPILLIASSNRTIPIDLKFFSVARLKLSDGKALRFHLDAFMATPKQSVFERTELPDLKKIERPQSEWISSKRGIGLPDSEIEKQIFDLIEASGGSAIYQPQSLNDLQGYRPDLLAWLGLLDAELLDPVAIEVKGRVNPKQLRDIEERLLKFMMTSGVTTGLIVTTEPVEKRRTPSWLNLFWLELDELRSLLETGQLGSHLRELRNRAAHGVR